MTHDDNKKSDNKSGIKTSTKWAIGLTGVWSAVVGVLIYLKWPEFKCMPPNEWGDFLAGTVSPLALLWLVAGYRQQGEELRLNTKALEAQLTELSMQVQATKMIAQNSTEQATISREMHNFNLEKTRLDQEAKRIERRRLIRPDIYLTKIVSNIDDHWEVQAKNVGADAFNIKVSSTQFAEINIHPDTSRFAMYETRTLHLSGWNPFTGFPFLTIHCFDADNGEYVFHYKYDEKRNSIVSLDPNHNGVLIEKF